MARQIIATANSFGFRGSYWEKNQVTELEAEEKLPEYFRYVSKEEAQIVGTQENDPATLADATKSELVAEAEGRGIKDAKILNQEELLEVLARETKEDRITEIIKAAKARGKKKK
jgi:hypothetical protein